MSRQRLNLLTLASAVQDRIETGTQKRCYDKVPENKPGPFYFVEVVNSIPRNTKTMYRDLITVWIHAIATKSESSVGIYNLIHELSEAMTENIQLSDPYMLLDQVDNGPSSIKTDETGEKHAVCSFDFLVAYGFICK